MYMRRNPTSAPIRRMAAAAIAIAALLAAPSCGKEGSDEPSGDGSIIAQITLRTKDFSGIISPASLQSGDCLHIYIGSTSHGHALFGSDGKWRLDLTSPIENATECTLVLGHAYTDDNTTSGNLSILYPVSKGDGSIIPAADGSYTISGEVIPATARIRFKGISGQYKVNYGAIGAYTAQQSARQPVAFWDRKETVDGECWLYTLMIPCIRIGDTVYRYVGPVKTDDVLSGMSIELPAPGADPSVWHSEPYMEGGRGAGAFQLYSNSSPKVVNIYDNTLSSELGLYAKVQFKWSPMSNSFADFLSTYPVKYQIWRDDNTWSSAKISSSDPSMQTGFSVYSSNIKSLKLQSNGFDVDIDLEYVKIANF